MYKTSNGIEVYESVDDLLKKGITHIWDYQNVYYIRVKLDDHYDNRIWIVDKNTKQVSSGIYLDVMEDILDKATLVDPEVLKRVS